MRRALRHTFLMFASAFAAVLVALACAGCVLPFGLSKDEAAVLPQGVTQGLRTVGRHVVTDKNEGGAMDFNLFYGATFDLHVAEIVRGLTLEQKVAQLFVVQPEALGDAYPVTYPGELTRYDERPVGGVLLMGDNIAWPDQTSELTAGIQALSMEATGLPAFVCVDEEGGTVARVAGNPAFGVDDPGNMRGIGATGDTDYAWQEAWRMGNYLRDLGFNVDFAPDSDIAGGPWDFIWYRSFGTDADLVSSMVQAQVRGFAESGILCTVKHFPGIGGIADDSHAGRITSARTVEEMRSWELLPFDAAIDAGVPMVMVGHLSCTGIDGGAYPASLSPAMVDGLLRNDLGYDRLVITDSLGMGAVTEVASPYDVGVLAIEAGCDLILSPEDFEEAYQGVLDAVSSGRISQERLDQSVTRIVRAKLGL